jgi:alpha-beta hydrolase superfamily lysophospholipase
VNPNEKDYQGKSKPYVTRPEDLEQKKIDFYASTFPVEDHFLFKGQKIHHVYQPSSLPETRGTIIHHHGFGDYTSRYHHLALELSKHGFEFYGIDYLGYGQSEGKRGTWESFEELFEFNKEFHEMVQEKRQAEGASERPLFFTGHSLGGMLATQMAIYKEQGFLDGKVDGIVAICPFFGITGIY